MILIDLKLSNPEKASVYGRSLDKSDFRSAHTLMNDRCIYDLGDEKLVGADLICNFYKTNADESMHLLDEVQCEKSRVVDIDEQTYIVHFKDILKHKGEEYMHCSAQRLCFDTEGRIRLIEQIHEPAELRSLEKFYRRVGLL